MWKVKCTLVTARKNRIMTRDECFYQCQFINESIIRNNKNEYCFIIMSLILLNNNFDINLKLVYKIWCRV